ncbi:MAG: carboxymethylenebutenolidase [Actinomycetota bacterium]|jgi:carboxymethylenebutenolidase|nr:carboxymethylenebutenolidase [Actinomycetota bacterium]
MGQTIAVGATSGYLATPEMGAGPALIVITEPGRAEHGERVCDLLATEGFTALAPELRNGETAADLAGAIELLKPHPAVRGHGLGVIGFSTGSGLALWLAAHRPDDVAAVAAYYGVVPDTPEPPDWSRLTAAVQGHYGEADPGAPPEAVAQLESALGGAGVTVEMFTYPGAGAGFFDDTQPDAHVEDAARQAWIRTLEFLRKHLG